MALLEWIGLGFLIAWLTKSLARIGAAFGAFFSAVWHAHGDPQIHNLGAAITQLGGYTGEHPPRGFQRIADIRIAGGKNPLRSASRPQLLAALRGNLSNLDDLLPPDSTPG
jgi:hypothetical protein